MEVPFTVIGMTEREAGVLRGDLLDMLNFKYPLNIQVEIKITQLYKSGI